MTLENLKKFVEAFDDPDKHDGECEFHEHNPSCDDECDIETECECWLGYVRMLAQALLDTRTSGQALYDLLCEQMPDSYQESDSRMEAWRKVTS